eukprot:15441243-Alexandrium_andersonii.AAC.1
MRVRHARRFRDGIGAGTKVNGFFVCHLLPQAAARFRSPLPGATDGTRRSRPPVRLRTLTAPREFGGPREVGGPP